MTTKSLFLIRALLNPVGLTTTTTTMQLSNNNNNNSSAIDFDESGRIAKYLLDMNESFIASYLQQKNRIGDDLMINNNRIITITFSHFLPRRELMPDKKFLYFKPLTRVSGSVRLDDQLRALGSSVHVFGHTHINMDKTVDGVRYVQNAMKYPREHKGVPPLPKLVWEYQVRVTNE
eukprot:GEZU01017733.1.p1 GENE.GEZU01017733.1~~GEZU01017733.1.p1  ORF type:complete len:176 (+),score=45.94 GEZU01017733.1:136-663(+)